MHQIHTVTLNPVIDLIYKVDEYQKGTTFRSEEFRLVPAGKGINVSYALALLGDESHAFAPVGWKECELFSDACRERGVHFHPFTGVYQTRRHCTILESATGSTTHVQIKGEPIPLNPIRELIDDLILQIQADDWVAFSGSVAQGVPSDIYAEMIKRCHKRGAKVILDTSGIPLCEGVEAGPDLLKVNQSEAEELSGIPICTVEDASKAVRILMKDAHIPLIALSLGELGLMAGVNGELLYFYILMNDDEIRDTVGCGDAMVAGILYGLNHGFDPEAMFRYGIACASAAAMQIGPAYFEWADMECMLNRITVQEIDRIVPV